MHIRAAAAWTARRRRTRSRWPRYTATLTVTLRTSVRDRRRAGGQPARVSRRCSVCPGVAPASARHAHERIRRRRRPKGPRPVALSVRHAPELDHRDCSTTTDRRFPLPPPFRTPTTGDKKHAHTNARRVIILAPRLPPFDLNRPPIHTPTLRRAAVTGTGTEIRAQRRTVRRLDLSRTNIQQRRRELARWAADNAKSSGLHTHRHTPPSSPLRRTQALQNRVRPPELALGQGGYGREVPDGRPGRTGCYGRWRRRRGDRGRQAAHGHHSVRHGGVTVQDSHLDQGLLAGVRGSGCKLSTR